MEDLSFASSFARPSLPPNFRSVLYELSRHVLRHQPQDLAASCAAYFDQLLAQRGDTWLPYRDRYQTQAQLVAAAAAAADHDSDTNLPSHRHIGPAAAAAGAPAVDSSEQQLNRWRQPLQQLLLDTVTQSESVQLGHVATDSCENMVYRWQLPQQQLARDLTTSSEPVDTAQLLAPAGQLHQPAAGPGTAVRPVASENTVSPDGSAVELSERPTAGGGGARRMADTKEKQQRRECCGECPQHSEIDLATLYSFTEDRLYSEHVQQRAESPQSLADEPRSPALSPASPRPRSPCICSYEDSAAGALFNSDEHRYRQRARSVYSPDSANGAEHSEPELANQTPADDYVTRRPDSPAEARSPAHSQLDVAS